jgi:hypothetical protein
LSDDIWCDDEEIGMCCAAASWITYETSLVRYEGQIANDSSKQIIGTAKGNLKAFNSISLRYTVAINVFVNFYVALLKTRHSRYVPNAYFVFRTFVTLNEGSKPGIRQSRIVSG